MPTCSRSVIAAGAGRCALAALLLLSTGSTRAGSDAEPTDRVGVLLLTNGRLLSGTIRQHAGGYILERPNGSLLVPFEKVKLEAADRRDAYRKLARLMPERTATNHIALARWCLGQNLLQETRTELRAALQLEPNRTEARRMLVRLEELLNPKEPLHGAVESPPDRTDDGFQVPDARSLSGLAPETAREFVTVVQPILMNKCANARCHGGGARNEFRLSPVRSGRGSSRVLAERNLASVLKHVDFTDAEASPLLVAPRGNHGRGGQAIFGGYRGAEQIDRLRKWVLTVVAEETPQEGTQSDVVDTIAAESGDSLVPREFDASPSTAEGSITFPPKSAADGDPLLEAILREERKDAFDPEEFNRKGKRRIRRD